MNAYKVIFKIKNGGYKEEDMVTNGGYYDTRHQEVVYASDKNKALKLTSLVNPKATGIKAKLLMKNV